MPPTPPTPPGELEPDREPDRFTAEALADYAARIPGSPANEGFTLWAKDSSKINDVPDAAASKAFLAALQKTAPFASEEPVYRGMKFKTKAKRDAFLSKIITDGAYEVDAVARSFSKDIVEAAKFTGSDPSLGLIFQVNEHKHMVDLEPTIARVRPEVLHQREVVALKGRKLKVTGHAAHSGIPVVHMREVP